MNVLELFSYSRIIGVCFIAKAEIPINNRHYID